MKHFVLWRQNESTSVFGHLVFVLCRQVEYKLCRSVLNHTVSGQLKLKICRLKAIEEAEATLSFPLLTAKPPYDVCKVCYANDFPLSMAFNSRKMYFFWQLHFL